MIAFRSRGCAGTGRLRKTSRRGLPTGYVRGEGCGVIAHRRLEDGSATATDPGRDPGSAVNQDGASGGLTVPNGVAQQRVITEALSPPAWPRRCRLPGGARDRDIARRPHRVQAAAAVLGRGRDTGQPLLIGSAKTNIGHLEAAAGIAGVLRKSSLSLEHRGTTETPELANPSPPSRGTGFRCGSSTRPSPGNVATGPRICRGQSVRIHRHPTPTSSSRSRRRRRASCRDD